MVNNTKATPPGKPTKHIKLEGDALKQWESKQEEEAKKEAEYQKKYGYINQRKKEYPSIQEQLDLLYHKGYAGWRQVITDIKNKHKKPDNKPYI